MKREMKKQVASALTIAAVLSCLWIGLGAWRESLDLGRLYVREVRANPERANTVLTFGDGTDTVYFKSDVVASGTVTIVSAVTNGTIVVTNAFTVEKTASADIQCALSTTNIVVADGSTVDMDGSALSLDNGTLSVTNTTITATDSTLAIGAITTDAKFTVSGGGIANTGGGTSDNWNVSSDLTVGGDAAVTGDLAVNGDDISTDANLDLEPATGTVNVRTNLNVEGTGTFGAKLTVSGGGIANTGGGTSDNWNVSSDLTVGGDAAVTGTLTAEQLTSTDDAAIYDLLTAAGGVLATNTSVYVRIGDEEYQNTLWIASYGGNSAGTIAPPYAKLAYQGAGTGDTGGEFATASVTTRVAYRHTDANWGLDTDNGDYDVTLSYTNNTATAYALKATDGTRTAYLADGSYALNVANGPSYQAGYKVDAPATVTGAAGTYTQTVATAFIIENRSGIITQKLANPAAAGILLDIYNQGANNVILLDGDANLDLGGGNVTLGQTDLISLRSVSTSLWIKRFVADN